MSLSPIVRSVLGFAFATAIVHCYSGSTPPVTSGPQDGGAGASGVTFHKDVEPILQKSCQGCHLEGGIAPFSLIAYADAKAHARDLVTQTQARNMPPWGAQETPDCTPTRKWKQDLRLGEAELATLKSWSDDGAPEGDPKDAPPPLTATAPGLQGVTDTLKTAAPYAMTSTNDDFRCFVIDPALATTRYLNGSFFIAGNPTIVHHALLFSDPAGESKSKVTDVATQSYGCQGGAGIAKTGLLAAWAPGGVPNDLPSNIGATVAAGTLLVLQVHYHPHLDGPQAADQTTVQLRFSDTKPEYNLVSALIGNFSGAPQLLAGPDDPAAGPAFVIPANASGHTETMNFTMPKGIGTQVYVYGVAAHMHYVGVSETVKILRASSAAEECLLSVPRWDFSWQRGYAYDTEIASLPTLSSGDIVDIKCTYENTMKNPKLAASLVERKMSAPIDVHLGETTLDEMCLAPLSLIYKNP
jgi:hypothetical protein